MFQQWRQEVIQPILPPEKVQDPEHMQYVLQDTDEQWKHALISTSCGDEDKQKKLDAIGLVQIQCVQEKQ
jgi:hypothetical protein